MLLRLKKYNINKLKYNTIKAYVPISFINTITHSLRLASICPSETGLCYTPLSTVSGLTRVFEIGVHFESDDDSQLGQRSASKSSLPLLSSLLSLVYRKLVLEYNASLRTRKRLKWNVWWTLHRSIPRDSITSSRQEFARAKA